MTTDPSAPPPTATPVIVISDWLERKGRPSRATAPQVRIIDVLIAFASRLPSKIVVDDPWHPNPILIVEVLTETLHFTVTAEQVQTLAAAGIPVIWGQPPSPGAGSSAPTQLPDWGQYEPRNVEWTAPLSGEPRTYPAASAADAAEIAQDLQRIQVEKGCAPDAHVITPIRQ